MTGLEATATWWRPKHHSRRVAAADQGSPVAFGALMAFTAILLLSPQAWFPVLRLLRIAFLAAGLAIGAHVVDCLGRRKPVDSLHPEITVALALVGWAALTIPLSQWPGGSVAELTDHLLKAVAFFWLIGTLVTTGRRLQQFMWLLVLCAIPLSLTALQNYSSGVFLRTPVGSVQRIAGYSDGGSGLAANPNDLALMLNLLIPFAGAIALSGRGVVQRAVATVTLLLSAAAVIVTFSRAGFLALIATIGMSLIATARRKPLLSIALLTILLVSIPLLPTDYQQRLSTIADISTDPTGSAQGRWNDLTVAADVVGRYPMTGVGLGQNVLALNRERGATWREVHNVYLQYTMDLGVPGLLLFLWLFVAVYRTASRVRRGSAREPGLRAIAILAASIQASLVAFAVAAFFHPVAYQFYFFCVAGLALAVKTVYDTDHQSRDPRLSVS